MRITDKDIIKFVGYFIRTILLLGILFQIIITIYQIIGYILELNFIDLITDTIVSSLLILVLLELYIAIIESVVAKYEELTNGP
ncbi:MAG: hypothetical protein QXV58_14650, partial [Saccharolobus sp.]